MKITRICLWSGPRNISTALMYAFAQRSDTVVYDEPLYAYYLAKTGAHSYHPGAAEVLASQPHEAAPVMAQMMGPQPKPVVFFKHMAHHLVELDWHFMADVVNVILTRDPAEMLTSYIKQIDAPTLADTGYDAQIRVMEHVQSLGKEILVLDARQVLLNPRQVLGTLCERIGIPFEENMLSWKAGARPEDGAWAPHWYKSVHQSTGFAAYQPKNEPLPPHLQPLLEQCRPLYARMRDAAISGE